MLLKYCLHSGTRSGNGSKILSSKHDLIACTSVALRDAVTTVTASSTVASAAHEKHLACRNNKRRLCWFRLFNIPCLLPPASSASVCVCGVAKYAPASYARSQRIERLVIGHNVICGRSIFSGKKNNFYQRA